jgi:hypothetical protein
MEFGVVDRMAASDLTSTDPRTGSLTMGRSAAAWGCPALPGSSTNAVSRVTTILIG